MIELHDVTRRYRSGDIETHALAGVSLSVGAGEFVALMGPSGCGKSTLLSVLGLLDPADGGSYQLFGEEVGALGETGRTRVRRAHLGFVFQNFNLIDELTVAENVEVALLYRTGARTAPNRVEAVLEQVGLAHRAGHRPRQLSGGQQQRVAIARALASSPALILADEPTGNLDSVNGEAVIDLLASLGANGTTVVMATHSPTHAAAAARTIDMLDGRIVEEARL